MQNKKDKLTKREIPRNILAREHNSRLRVMGAAMFVEKVGEKLKCLDGAAPLCPGGGTTTVATGCYNPPSCGNLINNIIRFFKCTYIYFLYIDSYYIIEDKKNNSYREWNLKQ